LNGKTFKPSAKYTYDDIYYGVPMMLTAIEAMLFSFAFHFAFRSRIYHEDELRGHGSFGVMGGSKGEGPRRMKTWRAIFDAMNLTDIVHGIITGFWLLIKKSSPNGHGIRDFGLGNPTPKRQRTQELNNMALEPFSQQQQGPRFQAQDYHQVQNTPQEYGVLSAHSTAERNSDERLMAQSYDDYRADSYREEYGRNPRHHSAEPGMRTPQMPRDMV
jgi:hypothetical protein